MSEQRGLLVARNSAYRNISSDNSSVAIAEVISRRQNFGQHTLGDTEELQKFFVPTQLFYIVQHSTACIGVVGCVNSTRRQLPHKIRIYGTEEQFSSLGFFFRTLDIVEYPFDFRSRKISVDSKTRLSVNFIVISLRFERIAVLGSTSALPYDSVVYGFTRIFIPHDSSFALIGNTDSYYRAERYMPLFNYVL